MALSTAPSSTHNRSPFEIPITPLLVQLTMKSLGLALGLLLALMAVSASADQSMPCPFTRVLSLQTPPVIGKDITILQAFLARCSCVPFTVNRTGVFDSATSKAVASFQTANNIAGTGVVDAATAEAVLDKLSDDMWRDPQGKLPVPAGLKYKVWIPVHKDRSIETQGLLLAANGTILYTFTARTQGQPGCNQFCGSGDTPTGYGFFDLNSPEPDPVSYGPYPVNRVAWGIEGNQGFLLRNDANYIRNGILLHTGEWKGWKPSEPMPPSHGCIHTHPQDAKNIYNILTSIGVEMRDNPFGTRPYPYKPQGVISISLVDD